MAHTAGKNQVVKIDGDSEVASAIEEAICLWQQCSGGGPKISFSTALRHLAEIGAKFEKNRILSGEFPFSTDQAMKLHAHRMAGGRQLTHLERK